MPKVNLYATFRDLTGKSQLELPGATVGEVLENLVRAYPALKEELFEGEGLAERVSVFLEGRDVRYLQGLSTPSPPGPPWTSSPRWRGAGLNGPSGPFPLGSLSATWRSGAGRGEGEGVYRLPGAVVRFREVEPLKVGSLSIPQLRVEVEGEEAERWFERIAFAASRGGG